MSIYQRVILRSSRKGIRVLQEIGDIGVKNCLIFFIYFAVICSSGQWTSCVSLGETYFFCLSATLFLCVILLKFFWCRHSYFPHFHNWSLTFLFAHGCSLAWQKHCPQFCFSFTILVVPGDDCEPPFSWNGWVFIPSEILVRHCIESWSHLLFM